MEKYKLRKLERYNDHIFVRPGVCLPDLEPACYMELMKQAFYCAKRHGWITIVHAGAATKGHSSGSVHYEGLAVDLHIETDAGVVVPLFDQFIASTRFDWNGRGLYPFWLHPGMHLDMREEGDFDEAALWWRDEDGTYKGVNAGFMGRIFGDD